MTRTRLTLRPVDYIYVNGQPVAFVTHTKDHRTYTVRPISQRMKGYPNVNFRSFDEAQTHVVNFIQQVQA